MATQKLDNLSASGTLVVSGSLELLKIDKRFKIQNKTIVLKKREEGTIQIEI
jgi:hypothetical protein